MTEYLSHLLFPLSTDSFLKHYQAREHLHVARGSAGYYADLLSVAELDTVLQSQQMPAASLNVVKDGVRYPIEEWSRVETTPRGAQRVAIPEALLSLYAGGATLILNQLHCALPSLNHACRMLTEELGFPTQTNIYITPRAAAGFSKHADEHEVLILQIAGSKFWIIYPPDAPPVEIDLQSGDLLYLPRGMFHAARARDEDSIHITLGLRPVYGFQLIQDLAALASELESFRRPMPPRFAGSDAGQAFARDFLARLQNLIAGIGPSRLTDLRRDELLLAQAQGWPGRFSDLRILHLITTETVVSKRPGILTAVKDKGKFLSVEFADREVTIPAFMRAELPRILGEREFTVAEIGGMITTAGKVKFVREFVSAGVLRIVSIGGVASVSEALHKVPAAVGKPLVPIRELWRAHATTGD